MSTVIDRVYINGVRSDGAYMPVPRCDQCKHWNGKHVVCEVITDGYRKDMAYVESRQSLAGELICRPSFGCVLWEPKEEPPVKSKSMAKRIAALKGRDAA